MTAPFRWNIARRAELGRLLEGERPSVYAGFHEDLARCAARVVAIAGEGDIVFVGRSPESLFDYLSGVWFDTSFRQRIHLLQLSVRLREQAMRAEKRRLLEPYLASLDLLPDQIARRSRRVTFCDLVYTGDTFGRLYALLGAYAKAAGSDWNAAREHLGFCGITQREKTSPNTYRWHQRAPWTRELPARAVRNVSIPAPLWQYLGNRQDKTTPPFVPDRWGQRGRAEHSEEHLRALRFAADLFDRGREPLERRAFAAMVAATPEMKARAAGRAPWLRSLILTLK